MCHQTVFGLLPLVDPPPDSDLAPDFRLARPMDPAEVIRTGVCGARTGPLFPVPVPDGALSAMDPCAG